MMQWKKLIIPLLIAILLVLFRVDLIIKPFHAIQAKLADRPILSLDIADKDWQVMDSLRNDALETRYPLASHKQYVSATLDVDGKPYEAQVRLKGDRVDHYKGNPPSFRIKLPKGDELFGERKYSLQHPRTRNNLREWIFLKLLEENGMMRVSMDLIELQFREWSEIRVLEGHFSEAMFDRHNRPVGPIVAVSEEYFWNHWRGNDTLIYKDEHRLYLESPLKHYIKHDQHLQDQADSLLDGWRQGLLTTDQVFDIEKLAWQYAISDLCDTHHSLRWHNNRWYFNPESELLEPVGFDGSGWGEIEHLAIEHPKQLSQIQERLKSSEQFMQAYQENLGAVSTEKFLDDFFVRHSDDIDELTKCLYGLDLLHKNRFDQLYGNQQIILSKLDSIEMILKRRESVKPT